MVLPANHLTGTSKTEPNYTQMNHVQQQFCFKIIFTAQFYQNFVKCVWHMLWDKTKESASNMLIPNKRSMPLVFWHQQWLGDVLFTNKKLSYGRETERSLILFRLTSSVICKIMHKIGFLGHLMGHQEQYMRFIWNFLTKRNPVAEFHRENISFTSKTAN